MVLLCQFGPPTLQTSQYNEKGRGNTPVCITKRVQIMENSILGYYRSEYMDLIPHPALITRLCILGGVKGD